MPPPPGSQEALVRPPLAGKEGLRRHQDVGQAFELVRHLQEGVGARIQTDDVHSLSPGASQGLLKEMAQLGGVQGVFGGLIGEKGEQLLLGRICTPTLRGHGGKAGTGQDHRQAGGRALAHSPG